MAEKTHLHKLWEDFEKNFPPSEIVIILMFLLISISLNDVKFRWADDIRKHYWFQLLIVAAFTYLVIHRKGAYFINNMVVVVLVTGLFWLLTASREDEDDI